MILPDEPVCSLLETDALLRPYEAVIRRRFEKTERTLVRLLGSSDRLADVASGHEYFGLHLRRHEWVFREWAPNATAIFLIGDVTKWREIPSFRLDKITAHGVWEIRLPESVLRHGDFYRIRIHWPGGSGDRIPAYARRVVQDPRTLIFNAQVWHPDSPYTWRHSADRVPSPASPIFIYEAHVGMAQEAPGIGSYREFMETVLPRVVRAGYNTLQLMAIQEHPYYASFGYQVSSFFAASARFGTPEDLKALVDAAHGEGVRVIMDLIHSHAVQNEVEGLSRFDGTTYQYFHEGPRGIHTAWNSRCFDYGKPEVLHFLLSNCRFWLDAYRFDGFRFDGVTSMLYLDHGLSRPFISYDDYFMENVDEDALVYLSLANRLIHDLRPDAVTIAEDVSGYPGMALSSKQGGVGFDFRFAMGVPDHWIKLIKEIPDEEWPMGYLWHELTNRRPEERTVSYAESHDQALVGDQTLIFRLMGAEMYFHMQVADGTLGRDRALALHKMIRLITLATAGGGYLTFMGNEFGHPEWIDFPREGNGWSFEYARRQWRLADDPDLVYRYLLGFDRDMIRLAKSRRLLEQKEICLLKEHNDDKTLIFERSGMVFAFNFHPSLSQPDYAFPVTRGVYRMVMNTDDDRYGGHGRIRPGIRHHALPSASAGWAAQVYLPSRTAVVLERCPEPFTGNS